MKILGILFGLFLLTFPFQANADTLSEIYERLDKENKVKFEKIISEQQQDVELDEQVSLSTPSREQESSEQTSLGGGCLIATATFGSELAPQVQQLREIRDNSLLQTESGRSFMESFNQLYYSFSPGIADFERENFVFKEAVKLTITPLLISLSLLNYVDMDSESEVLGYGISLILLNVGMYFVLPAFVIHRFRKFAYS